MNNTHTQTSHNTALKIDGENNKILIVSEGAERFLSSDEVIDGLSLEITGNNNFIKLELPINFANGATIKILNDNAEIELGSSLLLGISLLCCHGNGQICKIKKNTVMVDVSILLVGNTELYIGEDCMFSEGPVYIMPCDGHSILDVETDNIVNIPAPITIGNHCWIGNSCKIIRGATLPNNTIVGIGAIVNKAFEEEYTILAGAPARVIKRGRKWHRKNPYLLMHGL
jgi:acetyltransferase-like isoleucine patch superfamily enzyme